MINERQRSGFEYTNLPLHSSRGPTQLISVRARTPISVLIMFIAYCLAFFNLANIPNYVWIEYIAIAAIGIYIMINLRYFVKCFRLKITAPLLLFCIWVLFSAYVNKYRIIDANIFTSACLFSMVIVVCVVLLEIWSIRGDLNKVITLFFRCQLLLVLCTDVLIIFAPNLFGMQNSYLNNYLIGNKFSVIYAHMILLAFFAMKNRQSLKKGRQYGYIAFLILSIAISVIVGCMTGLVGVIAFVVFTLLANKYGDKLGSPKLFVGLLLVSCLFVFFYSVILKNVAVQYFVKAVLVRNLDLTGRIQIYEKLPALLSGHLFLGYGYGTSASLGYVLGGFPDTQNGLAEWIWRSGIPATIFLLWYIYQCVKRYSRCKDPERKKRIAPLLACLASFSILASVEITIGTYYLILAALLFCLSDEREVCRRKDINRDSGGKLEDLQC